MQRVHELKDKQLNLVYQMCLSETLTQLYQILDLSKTYQIIFDLHAGFYPGYRSEIQYLPRVIFFAGIYLVRGPFSFVQYCRNGQHEGLVMIHYSMSRH